MFAISFSNFIENFNMDSPCTTEVVEEAYYSPYLSSLKTIFYKFENKWNKSFYYHWMKYKIYKWEKLVYFNNSVVKSWNKQFSFFLIPNYNYLCKNNFEIKPWDKIRILTTAEEAKNNKCWYEIYLEDNKLSMTTIDDGFLFSNANLAIVDADKYNNEFYLKFAIFYDEDNNLSTVNDNKYDLVCYKIKIWFCWDWIKQDVEDCDWESYCNSLCKLKCNKNNEDLDWDCIPNKYDLDSLVPENFNWIEDADWKPEINFNEPFKYFETNCDMCPCPYFDYDWIFPWAVIRATLWDLNRRYLYTKSKDNNLNFNK